MKHLLLLLSVFLCSASVAGTLSPGGGTLAGGSGISTNIDNLTATNLTAQGSFSGTLNATGGNTVTNGMTISAFTNYSLFFTNQMFGFVSDNWIGLSASNGLGLFITTSTNPLVAPTQITNQTRFCHFTTNASTQFSAPKIFRYTTNGIPCKYILSYNVGISGQFENAIGFTTSINLTNWTPVVLNDLFSKKGSGIQMWSPIVFEGPTNDLHCLAALVDGQSRKIFCFDLDINDLTTWSNVREFKNCTNGVGSSPGGGICVFKNGLFYLYVTTDSMASGNNYIYTNSALTSTGWGQAGLSGIVGSAPSMVNFNGTNILFYSYGSYYARSTNLLNWSSQSPISTTYGTEGGLFEIGLVTDGGYTIATNNYIFTNSTAIASGIASASFSSAVNMLASEVSANLVDAQAVTTKQLTSGLINADFIFGVVSTPLIYGSDPFSSPPMLTSIGGGAGGAILGTPSNLGGGNLTVDPGGSGTISADLPFYGTTIFGDGNGITNLAAGSIVGLVASATYAITAGSITNTSPALNGVNITNLAGLVFTNSATGFLTSGAFKSMPASGFLKVSVVVTNTQIVWLTNATTGDFVPLGNLVGLWTNYESATIMVNSGDSCAVTNISGSGGARLLDSRFQKLK